MTLSFRPAGSLTCSQIKLVTDGVRQNITNATIDLPEYSNPAFRLVNIKHAIARLQSLERQLETEVAINKAKKVKVTA